MISWTTAMEILPIDNLLGNHETQLGGGGGGGGVVQLYKIIAYCITHHVYNFESTYFTSEIQIILLILLV
jgi:hypothetical protein